MDIQWLEAINVSAILLGSIITLSGSAVALAAHVEMLVLFGPNKLGTLPGYYALHFSRAAWTVLVGATLSLLNVLVMIILMGNKLQVVNPIPLTSMALLQAIVMGILAYALNKQQLMHNAKWDTENTIFYHVLSGNLRISTVFYLASAGQILASIWLIIDLATFIVSKVN